MKTVKEVSELTGISVRTLHYYDEIGLFNLKFIAFKRKNNIRFSVSEYEIRSINDWYF